MHRYFTPLAGSSQTVPGTQVSVGAGPPAAATITGVPSITTATEPASSRRRPTMDDPPSPGARGGIVVGGGQPRGPGLALSYAPIDDALSPRGDDRERQRDAATFLGQGICMAGPPVDRMLGDLVDVDACPEQGGDDLPDGPRPGELPLLCLVGDRQAIYVLGCPALR